MPLEWLSKPIDPNAVGDLLARMKRTKAIAVLRAQLRQAGTPRAHVRLQLVDLLVLAGRGKEAVPILLGLSDEFAAADFVAKAIAILKRVEKIEPGREDVQSKLSILVNEQLRIAPTLSAPMRMRPVLGIEEIQEVDDLSDADTGPPPPPEPEAREDTAEASSATPDPVAPEPPGAREVAEEPLGTSGTGDDAGEEDTGTTAAEPVPEAVASGETPDAVTEPEPPTPDSSPGVRKRIQGVFRRFLATLPGSPGGAGVAGVPLDDEDGSSEADVPADAGTGAEVETIPDEGPAPEVETAVADEAASGAAGQEAEPEEQVAGAAAETSIDDTDEAPPPDRPDAELLLEQAVASDAAEPLSDAAFQDQLLDLVEDVLLLPREPVPAAASRPKPASLELGSRMVASPLFSGLSQQELLAVVRGLGLHTFQPGDVIVTEGEPGQSLFILAAGNASVFVRSSTGRDLQVAALAEGDFFGEITCLSGGPRTATVTAAAACEMLELDKTALDSIASTHPRVRRRLEDCYVERASSREAAAIRAARLAEPGTRERAVEVLTAHFGDRHWDPRMRLRLADVLLKAGKEEEAVPILAGLADELTREGLTEKAIAILKKIEKIQSRFVEEVKLAPLERAETGSSSPPAPPEPVSAVPGAPFQSWLVDLVRETVGPGGSVAVPTAEASVPTAARAYAPGLTASPLFAGLSEDELLAIIKGLRLLSFAPGDVIVTEGEPGQSLFILAEGSVSVFVRNAVGRNAHLCRLDEGAFFGEISTLSGRPRSATVTAASRCELLELDPPNLDLIARSHPRMREVLEEYSARRASSPEAERIRGARQG